MPKTVAPVAPAPALPDFIVHCLELLASLGAVRARRMFGGHGIDLEGLTLAIVVGEQLFLKADAQSAPQWQAAGSQPFSYATRQGRRVSMSYWSAPGDAMESPAAMRPWARLALDAALRARAAKLAPRPRKKKAG